VSKSYPAIAVVALVLGLAVAGCGGGGSSSSTSTGGEATSGETASTGANAVGSYGAAKEEPAGSTGAAEGPGAAMAATISVGSASGVGKVLVDSKGMTLYYFEKDQKGSGKSKCEGACAGAWPPLTTSGAPEAMSGVNASMLGTIERTDGTMQVTYAGWPLYTFVEDKKPGEDNGTDSKAFGASWYPIHANGEKAGH
jgi:predicted lipoprotein with Yx(FWY)xxD motif